MVSLRSQARRARIFTLSRSVCYPETRQIRVQGLRMTDSVRTTLKAYSGHKGRRELGVDVSIQEVARHRASPHLAG